MNEKEKIEFIKKEWNKFLEKKGLTISEYNKSCEEKYIEKIKQSEKSISFLKHAKTKSDIKYIFRAKESVIAAAEKAQEKDPEFTLPPELIEEYTLEVFYKIKPQNQKKEYTKPKDHHYGYYHSKNVYNMIVENSWYVVCHEYYHMNINDNADEINELSTDSFEILYDNEGILSLKGYRLKDIIN